jgi:hypothetical protein
MRFELPGGRFTREGLDVDMRQGQESLSGRLCFTDMTPPGGEADAKRDESF